MSYSSLLFEMLHFSPAVSVSFSFGMAVLGVVGTVALCLVFINRFGRRPIYILSHFAILACNCALLACQFTFEVRADTFSKVR